MRTCASIASLAVLTSLGLTPDATVPPVVVDANNADAADPVPPRPDAATTCAPRIVYTTGSSGAREVWTADADGGNPVNVSNNATADDFAPRWSPDGTRLLFVSNRTGMADIWTATATGEDARNLTGTNTSAEDMPVWSPDGSKIAFARDGKLWVMANDGTLADDLSDGAPSAFVGIVWSPDGSHILTGRRVGTHHDLFLVPATGGAERNITNTPDANETIATFSPDGARLAFNVSGSTTADLWTSAADGSDRVNLTPNTTTSADSSAVWTSGGQELIFASNRESGAFKLFLLPAAGGAPLRIYDNRLTAGATGTIVGDTPGFVSPDGTRISYTRYPGGSAPLEFGVVQLDGTNLTPIPGFIGGWSPCL
jgi:Tol biopolymer transport system component